MSDKSDIEWTDASWNPVSGCTRVSPGCDQCYAVRWTYRLECAGVRRYGGLTESKTLGRRFNGLVRHSEDLLDIPFHWRNPRRILVCSMSDLLHPKVPDNFIARAFAVMALCPQHDFQVLTKRPKRLAEWSTDIMTTFDIALHVQELDPLLVPDGPHVSINLDDLKIPWPLGNVWLGTSIENQAAADKRIPELLQCPAAVQFLSCEPLLGPMGLSPFLRPLRTMKCPCGHVFSSMEAEPCKCNPPCNCRSVDECLHDTSFTLMCPKCGLCACERKERWVAEGRIGKVVGSEFDWCLDPEKWSKRIHQVIVGGETGPWARPMDPAWVRSIRDECLRAGVPFFFKGWGEWAPLGALLLKGLNLPDRQYEQGVFVQGRFTSLAGRRPIGDAPRRPGTTRMYRVGKKWAGRLLDGRTWDEMPRCAKTEKPDGR